MYFRAEVSSKTSRVMFNDLPELLLLCDLHAHRLLHCLERYMVAVSPHCARASAGLGFPSVCGSRQKPPPRCSSPCAWPARCRGGRSALVNHRSCQSWPPPRCSSPCAWPARWAGKLKTKYIHTYGPTLCEGFCWTTQTFLLYVDLVTVLKSLCLAS